MGYPAKLMDRLELPASKKSDFLNRNCVVDNLWAGHKGMR